MSAVAALFLEQRQGSRNLCLVLALTFFFPKHPALAAIETADDRRSSALANRAGSREASIARGSSFRPDAGRRLPAGSAAAHPASP